jgi:asparagine synthase (glutamine-hydrolysing)
VSAFTAVPSIAMVDARFSGRFCDESTHAAATAALYPNIEHILIPNISDSVFHTLDRMSSASESPQLNPGNSCWVNAISSNASLHGLRAILTGARGNATISWAGRGALSNLIATGRIAAAARLTSAMRSNGNSWSATVKSGVWPLLPSGLRRAADYVRGVEMPGSEMGARREFLRSAGLGPQEGQKFLKYLEGRSLRISAMRRGDLGGHIAGLRRLTGVEEMDPTGDRRVMEFCLSVPEEHYCTNGRGRSLIRDAMAGILPPKVLEEPRRGRQSADLLFHLTREKAEIAAELKRLKEIDLAVRCLNLPMLESLIQSWPSPPYGSREQATYGSALMRAISIGRFIRRIEEGTLFRDQLPVGTRLA